MRHAAKWRDMQEKIRWSRRLGLVGFIFFLGKGLFWLAMFAAAWWLR